MATTLDKPADLPVFPPHNDVAGDCLLARLLEAQPWRRDIAWPAGFEGGIVHRLDNATSGAILAADSVEELLQLRKWFGEHQLVKTYRMLAARNVNWDRHHCDAPLAHHPTKKSVMVVQRGRNTPHRGKWYPAHTEFRRLKGQVFEVAMRGGVMHQIRAHAAFLGIPILGDHRYGGGRREPDAGPTFFLHHASITGPDGFHSDPVAMPAWAQAGAGQR